MSRSIILAMAALVASASACGGEDTTADRASETTDRQPRGTATALASDLRPLSDQEIEAGRMDSSWRPYADARRGVAGSAEARDPQDGPAATAADSPGSSAATPSPDRPGTPRAPLSARDSGRHAGPAADTLRDGWDDISMETVNAPIRSAPVHGDVEGPAVAKVQILLDQAGFSPGVIDGRWGKNTEKAVYWFQHANGMDATGRADRATIRALEERAPGGQAERHTLTHEDVSGPFQDLPEDVYERAEQPCLCYESQREQLGEVFHATPALLEQLNPDVDLNTVQAGASLIVPAVERFHLGDMPDGRYTDGGPVARIVISDGGHYLHAMDEAGNIMYHFPSTLGADYAPSPDGEFSVRSITFDPTWHYKPDLLSRVDPSREDAVLPEGPNNAVGVVWMQLSRDHYGIHGTAAPATIGYAVSHGCVRLTNWDAAFLGQRIPEGVPVEFTDVNGRASE